MDDNVIGTASVKITADITPLQQSIQKAKQEAEKLKGISDNFTVNWMGEGSGSVEDYARYVEEATKEWEEYTAQQENVAQAQEKVTQSVQATTGAIQQQNATTEKSGSFFEQMGKKLQHASNMIGDSWRHAEVSVETASRKTQTALIGLATAITLYGKSAISEYAKYNKNAAETQEQLEKASLRMKLTIGQLLQPIASAISNIMNWVSQNRALVAGVGTAIAIIAGSAGLIAAVKKLAGAFAALKATAGGIVGILSLIAGVAVGAAVSADNSFVDYNETLEETKKHTEDVERATDSYNKAIADMNEQIAEAQKGIEKEERSYRQSLKKILVTHEDTVDKLTQQIKDANDEYRRAINERNAEFALNMQKEEELHADKVRELTNQINFLQRYNNKYNKEKLAQLQFALEEENNRHKKQTQLMQDELETQNQNEKEKLDERLKDYRKELDEELAFLKKHRTLLNGVRDEILDDEIESLTRQHEETLASYQKAIEDARTKGYEAGTTFANELAKANADVLRSGQNAGRAYGKGFGDTIFEMFAAVGQWIRDTVQGWVNWIDDKLFKPILGYQGKAGMTADKETANIVQYYKEKYGGNWKAEWQRQGMGPIPAGYSMGGYTGQGSPNEVAGFVHKGEYVLPQSMVDQNTGTPKNMGNTFNINVSGVFATSAIERRKVANDIMRAFQQTNSARLGA